MKKIKDVNPQDTERLQVTINFSLLNLINSGLPNVENPRLSPSLFFPFSRISHCLPSLSPKGWWIYCICSYHWRRLICRRVHRSAGLCQIESGRVLDANANAAYFFPNPIKSRTRFFIVVRITGWSLSCYRVIVGLQSRTFV